MLKLAFISMLLDDEDNLSLFKRSDKQALWQFKIH